MGRYDGSVFGIGTVIPNTAAPKMMPGETQSAYFQRTGYYDDGSGLAAAGVKPMSDSKHFQVGKYLIPKEAVVVAALTGVTGFFFGGPVGAVVGTLAGYVGDVKIRKP